MAQLHEVVYIIPRRWHTDLNQDEAKYVYYDTVLQCGSDHHWYRVIISSTLVSVTTMYMYVYIAGLQRGTSILRVWHGAENQNYTYTCVRHGAEKTVMYRIVTAGAISKNDGRESKNEMVFSLGEQECAIPHKNSNRIIPISGLY